MPKKPIVAHTIKDYNGRLIVPGITVAFNLSGTVAIGEVMSAKITSSTPVMYRPYIIHNYSIRVRNLFSHPYKKAGHISKITNPLNLVAIDVTSDFLLKNLPHEETRDDQA